MTIYEVYNESIKVLPAGDQLRLARLILDEIAPAEPVKLSDAASRRLEELVIEAINSGPAEPLTEAYKEDVRRELRTYAAGPAGA